METEKEWKEGRQLLFEVTGHHIVKDQDSWEMGNKCDEPYNCLSLLPWQNPDRAQKIIRVKGIDLNFQGEQSN